MEDGIYIDSPIGQVFAQRYRVIEHIGQGGMSAVYKAEHLVMGRMVALKVLARELALDDLTKRRFIAEAQITCRLQHHNAVILHDAGVENGLPYLVMELLSGRTLKDVIRADEPMPLQRVLSIIDQTCAALAQAHSLGIVHRDLKPSNIMLLEGDRVKVLDFGIAKVLHSAEKGTSDLTVVGTLVGTPHYMSPEQGQSKPVTHSSDIYSLGIVMYELLTGQLPFDGSSSVIILIKHANERPRPLREARPDLHLPPAVEGVVMKCLEKEPAQRYESMLELARDLRKAIRPDDSTTIAQTVVAVPEQRKFKPWHAGALLGAAAVLALFILAPRRTAHEATPPPMSGHEALEEAARKELGLSLEAERREVRRAEEELEAARKAKAEAEAARIAAEERARKAMAEAEALTKAQEESERQKQSAAQEEEARRAAEEAARLKATESQISELRRAQAEAEEARRLAEQAAQKALEEANAAKRAQEESEAARIAAARAGAATKPEAEAEALRKAQAEIEALKKAQAESQLAKELAEQAAAKARTEADAAKRAKEDEAAAVRAREEAEAAKRALADLQAAKRAADEAARRAQSEASALRQAEEKRERVRIEAEAKQRALREAASQRELMRKEQLEAQRQSSSVEPPPPPTQESPVPGTEVPRGRRRCGPNWC